MFCCYGLLDKISTTLLGGKHRVSAAGDRGMSKNRAKSNEDASKSIQSRNTGSTGGFCTMITAVLGFSQCGKKRHINCDFRPIICIFCSDKCGPDHVMTGIKGDVSPWRASNCPSDTDDLWEQITGILLIIMKQDTVLLSGFPIAPAAFGIFWNEWWQIYTADTYRTRDDDVLGLVGLSKIPAVSRREHADL